MDLQAGENGSTEFSEFWAGGSPEAEIESFADSDDWDDEESWEADFPEYMPESAMSDPEWVELAEHGIGVREAIAIAIPEFAELDDDELDEEVADILSYMSESEAEGFFNFIKGAARKALKVVAPIAGAAGRVVGTAIGGPVGTMIGGAAGDLVGRGARALDRQLARPSRRRRSRGGRRRRPVHVRRRRSAMRGYGRSLHAGARSLYRTAAPSVNRLGRQLRNPAAGAALGRAAGRQVANVAGRLSSIINSREMQMALSNAAAGLPAEIANQHGETAEAEMLAEGLRQAIIEAAEVLESVETDNPVLIESGELAEFVGQ